ncbi:hypothetical protein [Winogradskyella sp. A3E31]|uniref:hypothetical protein n=1 Tax=Winogradskyella sp. A3E31 TaxID=3349637 RepID=UPI00398B5382
MLAKNIQLLCIGVFLLFFNCKNDDSNNSPLLPNSGTIEFVKTFGGSQNDSGQSVVNTNDGGYAVLGFTQSSDGDIADTQNQSFKYWLLKFSVSDDLEWSKTYGGSSDDRGRDLIQTSDGGYAILGSSNSNDEDVTENFGSADYWLAKLDATGNISWQKSFGFQGNDNGISVIQTNDQGYLITGVLDVTASGGEGNTNRNALRHAGGDYWAIKLDTAGSLEWSRYFGGNFTDTPEGVAQTEDNGFIIAGGSDSADTDISNNIGSYDFWVVRISATGELVWENSFGGEEIDEARAIVKSGDGNFIIVGDTRSSTNDVSSNNGAADLWLIKISPEGELIWERAIGGTSFDVARDIVKTQDNGFLLAGSSRSSDGDVAQNKGQNDAWVLKVNSDGNLLWETSIGGFDIDFAYGVAQLNDGSVIAVGDTNSNDGDIIENKGFSDLLLAKLKK